jgi:beta-phosphoglucomutase
MLTGAIFDVDGVLVDSHPVHMRAWKRFLLSVGRSVGDRDMEFVLEGRKREEILRHFLGDLSADQVQTYGRQKELFFYEEANQVGTIAGLRGFLDELAGASISMGVASCGSGDRVHHLLNVLELGKYFQVVVTADDVVEGKPNPAIFSATAERLGIPISQVLCVEDSVSGVTAAKAARMKCLGIGQGDHKEVLLRAGADKVLPDFLPASLANLQGLFQ